MQHLFLNIQLSSSCQLFELLCNVEEEYNHRLDRVLGFFTSRPNWDPPPNPSLAGECSPPPLVFLGGTYSLAGGGVGVGSKSDEGTEHCGTLDICVLCESIVQAYNLGYCTQSYHLLLNLLINNSLNYLFVVANSVLIISDGIAGFFRKLDF